MTMLDRMRRHKAWLKWSLGIVVVAFVFLYVPQFLDSQAAGSADAIATVNGHKVTAMVFQRAYSQQVSQIRQSYGDVTDQMLRQLGISQRLMQDLVTQEAEIAEAERLGLTVTDGELKERLLRLPGLQEGGQFVGYERYRQMLAAARPPVREAEFEEDLRRSLMAEKLRMAVTGWMHVSDADVEQEFKRRNEKVKLDVAVFSAANFRDGITPTDADINAQFSAHTDTYKVAEKRRVRYLSIDSDALRARMTVTPEEIQARYNENVQSYSTPEQVRASHILFKTEGKDDAAVKKQAEAVLAKVKAGGDFAALAKQYSDDGSKANGGDLDYFGRNAMVKEFEDAAWGLKPGQVSDLVKSQFGYHIIKVADHRAAMTKPLDEVKAQLESQIRAEKATAEARRQADDLAKIIKSPADLDSAAQARGLTVGDSGLFSADEPLAGLGFAPAVSAEAFRLEAGKASGQIANGTGYVFIGLTEVKPAHTPTLDEVKDKVRQDVITAKAVDAARAKAAALSSAFKANFTSAAKAAGVAVRSTDFITRGSALPDVGVSDKIDTVAFGLKKGETSDPIVTDQAIVVVHVADRQDVNPAAYDTGKDTLRTQLLQQRRSEFFNAYMAKAMKGMTIKYNDAVISQLLGPAS